VDIFANNELHLTIQGQTITSMYGTVPQFMHNCEQLITAGISNDIFDSDKTHLSKESKSLLDELGNSAFEKYDALKQHPSFVSYLEKMSTLKYYGRANIGSRPAKRGKAKKLTLSDLRAISFVGSWSQLKHEQIVLPLLTIQQYALQKIAAGEGPIKSYESMVTRSLFGNINASRNSA